jgi:hypothetical protein
MAAHLSPGLPTGRSSACRSNRSAGTAAVTHIGSSKMFGKTIISDKFGLLSDCIASFGLADWVRIEGATKTPLAGFYFRENPYLT